MPRATKLRRIVEKACRYTLIAKTPFCLSVPNVRFLLATHIYIYIYTIIYLCMKKQDLGSHFVNLEVYDANVCSSWRADIKLVRCTLPSAHNLNYAVLNPVTGCSRSCANTETMPTVLRHIKILICQSIANGWQELAAVGEVGSHLGIETMAQNQCPEQPNS